MSVSSEAIDDLVGTIGVQGTIEVIETYVEWIDVCLRDLRDTESLGVAAHALRSTGRILGLVALAEYCERTDMAIVAGAPVDLEESMPRLRELARGALPFLNGHLQRLSTQREAMP